MLLGQSTCQVLPVFQELAEHQVLLEPQGLLVHKVQLA
jgi:hypothetical protein